jgi:carbonic anhydrase
MRTTRILFFAVLLLILWGASFAAAAGQEGALAAAPAFSAESAYTELVSGNNRFAAGLMLHALQDAQRRSKTAQGQQPFAMVLCCSDSRVPPEIIFDRGLGEIFVTRVAGNAVSSAVLGSLEYGAGHLGIPLLVVLGHSKCGAVTAVFNGEHLQATGNLAQLLAPVVPAAQAAKKQAAEAKREASVEEAVRANIWQTVVDIYAQSPGLKKLEQEGKLMILGALYDVETGKVEWLFRSQVAGQGKG